MTTDQLLDRIVAISLRNHFPPTHNLQACREITNLVFDYAKDKCDEALGMGIGAEIVALCARYDHPGVNPETHALARKVLVIAGERGEAK